MDRRESASTRRRTAAAVVADGIVDTIPAHSIPMALLGTFILAFGWFGFNAGSTLAGDVTQIGAQVIDVGANVIWVGASTLDAWKITSALVGGSRVDKHVEDIGLDLPEMGVLAYPMDREPAAILPEAPRRKAVEAA